MARWESGSQTSFQGIARRLLGWVALAALALAPAAVRAARLNEVRVGTHEDHTRIVLQLDAAADYRMVSSGKEDLVVALDAQSSARQVPSKSPLVRSVRVEPSGTGSTVHVKLAQPDVQVTEMILANPPRIVFDLARGEAPVASTTPKLPAMAAAKPEPIAPVAAPEPPPAPKYVAAADEKLVAAKPAEAPAKAAANDAVALPSPDAKTDDTSADRAAEPSAPALPEPPVAVEKSIAPPPAVPPAAGAPAHRAAPSVPAAPETADSSWLGLLMSPTGLLAVGGVLLLAIVLVAMRRRRAAADDDPLYSVMSAEDAGASAEEGQSETDTTVRWDYPEKDAVPAHDVRAFEADDDDQYGQLPLGRAAGSASSGAAPSPGNGAVHDDAAATSIFGGDPAPAPSGYGNGSGRIEASTTATIPMAPSAPVAQGDAVRMATEVEGRVAELERRLEQLVEARERLERQVAAQTEELRVQRAAIARTQRVVRSMTKGEELVTEPVPRAPNA